MLLSEVKILSKNLVRLALVLKKVIKKKYKYFFLLKFSDYSCAIQKDILVHGRLYVSQNYLCFYANIFRWETCLSVKWKDVTAVTKEKTARVIPNAIVVCTESERYFFTSFTTRDKAYLMLFRVWQNALMGKPMLPQEMWQWVTV